MHKVLRLHFISVKLAEMRFHRLARLVELFIRVVFSCDIQHSVKVGKNVKFYHNGLGVVIHPRSIIGDECSIYQNVTLGGNSKGKALNGAPFLGKNVMVGAGAIILGPVKIGDNVKIGANSVVTKNIESNTTVAGNPAKIIE